jgi:hypothetical protein
MIEIMTCRLRPGVAEDAFVAADRQVQTEFVPTHPGFMRRTTASGEGDEWVVVTLWASTADADGSAARGVDDPVVAAFRATLEPASVVTRRYTTLD